MLTFIIGAAACMVFPAMIFAIIGFWIFGIVGGIVGLLIGIFLLHG